MHWTVVDELRLPNRIGGHPALDFCNTWAGWRDPPAPGSEWLKDYDHLAVWSRHAQVLSADRVAELRQASADDAVAAEAALDDARRLRAVARAALVDPQDLEALAGVTRFVQDARAVATLAPGRVPTWEIPSSVGLALPVLAIAQSVGEFIVTHEVRKIGECPGDGCGWLFIDARGRRRWCSMAACGNRAKVRAHAGRQRHHAAPSGPRSE